MTHSKQTHKPPATLFAPQFLSINNVDHSFKIYIASEYSMQWIIYIPKNIGGIALCSLASLEHNFQETSLS